MKYFVKHNNEEKGPYLLDEIESFVHKGILPSYIKVRQEFNETWVGLNEFTKIININKDTTNTNSIFDIIDVKEDETVILSKSEIQDELIDEGELEKTILTKVTQKNLIKNEQDIKENIEGTFKQLSTTEKKIDKTKFYDIDEFKDALIEAQETEKVLESKEKNIESIKAVAKDPISRILMYGIIACVLAILFYDDFSPKEDEDLRKNYLIPEITLVDEIIGGNREKSVAIYEKQKEIPFYNYENLIKKTIELKRSLNEYYYKDALIDLAKAYALLLPFSSKKEEDSIVVANILESLGEEKINKNARYLEVWLIFYHNIGKYQSVKYLMSNYRKMSNKLTSIALAHYLSALQKIGDFKEISDLKSIFLDARKGDPYMYDALLNYFFLENRFEDYGNIFKEARSNMPENFDILKHGVRFNFLNKDYTNALDLLKIIKKKHVHLHKKYRSFYLESMGVITAVEGQFKKAQKYFKEALELNPRSDVVSILSDLEVNEEYNEISVLINKSKSIDAMLKSKNYLDSKDYEIALSQALNAVDFYESKESLVNLADVQSKLGYYGESIKNYQVALSRYGESSKINLKLLDAYISSYQLKSANVFINKLNTTAEINKSKYKELVAKYYYNKEKYLKSLLWLERSIQENKINDTAHYKMAKIYLDNGRPERAKQSILNAIKYEPSNLDYKILYSKIIHQQDGVETAIGYLRNIKSKYVNTIKINNQIAIFYYQSGQISNFQELEKKVKIDNTENTEFFLFMMNAASLEGNDDLAIDYARKYLLVNPADHQVGIELAKSYMRTNKYDEALRVLEKIRSRIETYPEINSLISKILLIKGDIPGALEYSQYEIDNNPELSYGYTQKAIALIKKDDKKSAMTLLKKAQRIDPSEIEMLKILAGLKREFGEYSESVDYYMKALEIDGDDHYLYFQLAQVYKEMGKIKEASNYYKTYLNVYPEAPEGPEIKQYLSLLNR